MAFRRKDVKKASYYLWFLGAKESKGLRGDQYIVPVLRYLQDAELQAIDSPPSKVTLQVSSKGLKIIQQVPKGKSGSPAGGASDPIDGPAIVRGDLDPVATPSASSISAFKAALPIIGNSLTFAPPTSSSKTEQIKHFIPHHSITWVSQEEDIVCMILLIYNPVTKCPVHVHAYRCDSIETATALRSQIRLLIERPENQKKFKQIEQRLAEKGLLMGGHPPVAAPAHGLVPTPAVRPAVGRNGPGSDGRSTRTDGSSDQAENLSSFGSAGSDLGYHGGKTSSPAGNGLSGRGLARAKSSVGQGESGVKPSLVPKTGRSLTGRSSSYHQDAESIPAPGQLSTMYESLAAELKAKLGNPKTGPILLPPRDYDTISRKRGKLEGVEARKSTNKLIVGPAALAKLMKGQQDKNGTTTSSPVTRSESSGKSSSGIGSDEALSSSVAAASGTTPAPPIMPIGRNQRHHRSAHVLSSHHRSRDHFDDDDEDEDEMIEDSLNGDSDEDEWNIESGATSWSPSGRGSHHKSIPPAPVIPISSSHQIHRYYSVEEEREARRRRGQSINKDYIDSYDYDYEDDRDHDEFEKERRLREGRGSHCGSHIVASSSSSRHQHRHQQNNNQANCDRNLNPKSSSGHKSSSLHKLENQEPRRFYFPDPAQFPLSRPMEPPGSTKTAQSANRRARSHDLLDDPDAIMIGEMKPSSRSKSSYNQIDPHPRHHHPSSGNHHHLVPHPRYERHPPPPQPAGAAVAYYQHHPHHHMSPHEFDSLEIPPHVSGRRGLKQGPSSRDRHRMPCS